MSSKSTIYRREHPEYYEQERIRDKERVKNLYHNNPEHRAKKLEQVKARYYRLKEAKANAQTNASISVN